jgi:glycosyltransferase involved in cell wall biosynthesis
VTNQPAGAPPRLSVILPCRNGAATLPTQLEALARQSWDGSWELVVSDNGSTDDSVEVIERYRDRLPGLRIVDSSRQAGLGSALNVGVAAARGESVTFVNDDDEVADGWLAAMGAALERHELVAGSLEVDKLNEPWTIEVRGRPQADGLVEWGFADYLPFAFCPTIGLRRRLHEAIGGFDEAMVPAAEDMDYCWRLQQAGAQFSFVPEAVTHYRFRHSLGEIFHQGLSYGEGHAVAYKKHRSRGLPRARRPLLRGLRSWAGLVKRLLLVRRRAQLALFVWHAGLRLGLVRGSIKHRVVFL